MNAPHLSFLLALSMTVAGAAAACGGGAQTGPGPQTPDTTASSGSAAPTDTGAPTGTTASTGTAPTPSATTTAPTPSGTGTGGTAPAPVTMKAPVASQMAADLQKIGLDPKNLPSMDQLIKKDKKKLRQVMEPLAKAVGLKCVDCHDGDAYDKPTRRKNIAMHMWDQFARGLTMTDGSPIFCDSCHQGRITLLDRSDKKALGKWMQANLVDPLARKDKKDHGCATCHGDEMDMNILRTWAKQ